MAPDARKPGTGINIFIDDDPPITGARIKVIGIGGGSTLARNAPAQALTVARAPPVSIAGWQRPVKAPKPTTKD